MFWYVRGKSILLAACRTIGDHSSLYAWGAIPMQTPRARRQPAINDVPPRPGPKTTAGADDTKFAVKNDVLHCARWRGYSMLHARAAAAVVASVFYRPAFRFNLR